MIRLIRSSSEQFHSTPETQTDESYNHPEDLEHFAHHEDIERKEAEKEAQFQGITVEEAIRSHDHVDVPPPTHHEGQEGDVTHQEAGQDYIVPHPHDEQIESETPVQDPPSVPKPKITRVTPPEKQDPSIKFKGASKEGRRKSEWGQGEEGFKAPKAPSDKMRWGLVLSSLFSC